MAQQDLVTYMPEKKLMKKNNPAACGSGTTCIFFEKAKKSRKN
jgi:hypothetical protein